MTSTVSSDEVTARFIALRREGLTDTEIAKRCGYSQSAVSARFGKARKRGIDVPPAPHHYTKGTLVERFWQCVDRNGPMCERLGTRCWSWLSHTVRGYARVADTRGEYGKAGRRYQAHRVSAMIHHGVSLVEDADVVVRHACDNARCTNPDHLEFGTQKDNIGDAIARGRMTWQQGRTPEQLEAQRVRGAQRRAAKLRKDRAA